MSRICGACGSEVKVEAPSYPVTCPQCGVLYGAGGEVDNHRPGSQSCIDRRLRGLAVVKVEAPK